MASLSLKDYMMYTILGIFCVMSSFYLIMGFSSAGGITLDDTYATTQFSVYETTLTTEKNKTETLYEETVGEVSPDTDSNDILGSWLTQGWGKLKDILGSTKKFTTFSFGLVKDVTDKIQIPSYITGIAIFALIIALLIIVFAVIIEHRGIKD